VWFLGRWEERGERREERGKRRKERGVGVARGEWAGNRVWKWQEIRS
jgi:hypothetical protein